MENDATLPRHYVSFRIILSCCDWEESPCCVEWMGKLPCNSVGCTTRKQVHSFGLWQGMPVCFSNLDLSQHQFLNDTAVTLMSLLCLSCVSAGNCVHVKWEYVALLTISKLFTGLLLCKQILLFLVYMVKVSSLVPPGRLCSSGCCKSWISFVSNMEAAWPWSLGNIWKAWSTCATEWEGLCYEHLFCDNSIFLTPTVSRCGWLL